MSVGIKDVITGLCENFIEYLLTIPKVQQNQQATKEIYSFLDYPWLIGYLHSISDQFQINHQLTLNNLIVACHMKPADFNQSQRDEFLRFLKKLILLHDSCILNKNVTL